jgi:hypothetical protein
MDADLDLLLIAVYCTADDLLPAKAANARRRIADAEVITLCIAQAMLGVASDERFLAAARHRLSHLFPALPERSAFHKRRLRLSDVIEGLIAEFARHSPGFVDDVLLVDSTPVECARSLETARRSRLGDAADYGYCASHSRLFWGFRLHALFAMDGTPRGLALTSPKIDEKTVCLQMVARCERQPGQMLILIGDKNFRGRQFETDLAAPTSRRSANASSRSSGPPRTSSASNATAHAPWTTCACAWPLASPPWPPPSRSTTASTAPPARWPATPPKRVAQLI